MGTKQQKAVDAGESGMSFDQRLARLEAIVGELENGGIALEPAIDRYQEGVGLLRECHAILASYKQRVEELSATALEWREYPDDPDAVEKKKA